MKAYKITEREYELENGETIVRDKIDMEWFDDEWNDEVYLWVDDIDENTIEVEKQEKEKENDDGDDWEAEIRELERYWWERR